MMKLAVVLGVLSLLTVPFAAAQDGPSVGEAGQLLVPADLANLSGHPSTEGSCGDGVEALLPVSPVPQSCTTIHDSCNDWYLTGECCANGQKQRQKVCFRCYECTSRDEPFCQVLFNYSCNGGSCS